MAEFTGTVDCVLPVQREELWALLSDPDQMLKLDPMLESYEPETGQIAVGTTNRAVSRFGPFRMSMQTKTQVLDRPARAVFESVQPAKPVRVTVEDTLSAEADGTRYTIRVSAQATVPLGRVVAPLLGRFMLRSRRKLLDRLAKSFAANG